jgi:hypothetical protein
MLRTLIPVLVTLLAGLPAWADEPEEEQDETRKASFRIEENVFARSVNVDHQGKCKATSGVALKAWYVPSFPASIPPFESCTTVASDTARGTVDIRLAIVSRKKRTITKIDGVLDLGTDGKATQAIDWDHVEIPAPGTYHLVVRVEGDEVARFPMRFKKRGGARK